MTMLAGVDFHISYHSDKGVIIDIEGYSEHIPSVARDLSFSTAKSWGAAKCRGTMIFPFGAYDHERKGQKGRNGGIPPMRPSKSRMERFLFLIEMERTLEEKDLC